MKLEIINSHNQYVAALERFEQVFRAEPGSAESDMADILSKSIKAYEDMHFIIDAPVAVQNSDRMD